MSLLARHAGLRVFRVFGRTVQAACGRGDVCAGAFEEGELVLYRFADAYFLERRRTHAPICFGLRFCVPG